MRGTSEPPSSRLEDQATSEPRATPAGERGVPVPLRTGTRGSPDECPDCGGNGWWHDHCDQCYAIGEWCGCGGQQRLCATCGGVGVLG